MSKLKPMNKVNVTIRLVHDSVKGVIPETTSLSFIYGIGREGLSPFECCLDEGRAGDHVHFTVKSSEIVEAFGGLFSHVSRLVRGTIVPKVMVFDIEIISIEEVDNREVVAALAGSTGGCEGGGSCGCS